VCTSPNWVTISFARKGPAQWSGFSCCAVSLMLWTRCPMSQQHSLAPGHWGHVESCGPVALETDFTVRRGKMYYFASWTFLWEGLVRQSASSEPKLLNGVRRDFVLALILKAVGWILFWYVTVQYNPKPNIKLNWSFFQFSTIQFIVLQISTLISLWSTYFVETIFDTVKISRNTKKQCTSQ
jgi:hypothetical protein